MDKLSDVLRGTGMVDRLDEFIPTLSSTARAMNLRRIPAAAALLAAMSLSQGAWADSRSRYSWEVEDSRDGFAVYSSGVPDHDYDAVKVVAVLDVSASALVDVLQNFANYPRWYYQCVRARVLERPKQSARIHVLDNGQIDALLDSQPFTLFVLQRSGVLDDRWAVVRIAARLTATHALVLEFQSLDSYAYEPPPGSVRMRMRGAWTLSPLGPNRTHVTLVLDVDPNTSTPTFLVDPRLADVAIQTVHGLRRITAPSR